MKFETAVRVSLAMLALVVFGRATCGKPKPAGIQAVQAMKIRDNVYYHNIGITYGDGYYYTINGGNDGYGMLNVYDGAGRPVNSYEVDLDGRAVFYQPDEEILYVKDCGTNLYFVSPEDGESSPDLEEVFYDENSSPGFSPDGEYIYELTDGEVHVLESFFGDEEDAFALSHYSDEHGFSGAIAASENYLFVWDADRTVYVYDLDGEYIDSFKLPRTGFGFSLSWANGMLWIAEDADGVERDDLGDVLGGKAADGYWYGYKITGLE